MYSREVALQSLVLGPKEVGNHGNCLSRVLEWPGLYKRTHSELAGLAELMEVDENTRLLYAELEERLGRMRAEGFVDMKVLSGRSSPVRDKLWVLNNVLRLSEEGKTKVMVLER